MCDVVAYVCVHINRTLVTILANQNARNDCDPQLNGSTFLRCGMIEWHSRFDDAKIKSEIFLTNE